MAITIRRTVIFQKWHDSQSHKCITMVLLHSTSCHRVNVFIIRVTWSITSWCSKRPPVICILRDKNGQASSLSKKRAKELLSSPLRFSTTNHRCIIFPFWKSRERLSSWQAIDWTYATHHQSLSIPLYISLSLNPSKSLPSLSIYPHLAHNPSKYLSLSPPPPLSLSSLVDLSLYTFLYISESLYRSLQLSTLSLASLSLLSSLQISVIISLIDPCLPQHLSVSLSSPSLFLWQPFIVFTWTGSAMSQILTWSCLWAPYYLLTIICQARNWIKNSPWKFTKRSPPCRHQLYLTISRGGWCRPKWNEEIDVDSSLFQGPVLQREESQEKKNMHSHKD